MVSNLISLDATLIFQIINTLLLLVIVIGLPVLVVWLIRNRRRQNERLKVMEAKLDQSLGQSRDHI